MTSPVTTAPTRLAARPLPIRVPLWAWALVALALVTMYVLLQENGALLTAQQASYVHELTHDARHALGVPCH
jgi:hypothetical protein